MLGRVRAAFADEPARVDAVGSLAEARAALAIARPSVVVAMLRLPDGFAVDLLDGRAGDPPFPLVVLAERADEREAVEVIKAGAIDYVALSGRALAALPHIARAAVRELQHLRRARIAEDRLRHADRLIGTGRLAAVAAHEIGTPLNVARMRAQLLAESPQSGDAVREACQTIVTQLDRVADQLRGMLDYAQAGTPGVAPLALDEVVASAVALLRPLAVRQGVTLQLLPAHVAVQANRSAIQQVVFNLVANALHALPRGGSVDVTVEAIDRDGAPLARVRVCDDGPGVPEAIRERVFDAFFTTRSAAGGTGLGLAVSREIAAAHGGALVLEPSPAGASFALELPRLSA